MKMLLAMTAITSVAAFAAVPAAAAETRSSNGVRIHSGSDFTDQRHGSGRFDRRDRRRHSAGDVIIGDWVGGEWALYNNRSFEHDSYNDWWHERPWRSYPRWVTSGGCDRLWWGGGNWRCGW